MCEATMIRSALWVSAAARMPLAGGPRPISTLAGMHAGLQPQRFQPRLAVLYGVLDQLDRQIDRHIGRDVLDDIEQDDLAALVEQRRSLAKRLLAAVDGADFDGNQDFLVHVFRPYEMHPTYRRKHKAL